MRRLAPIWLLLVAPLVLTACKGLEPPISVGHRESLAGQGLVLTLTNTSDDDLHEVVVRIVAPDETEKVYTIPTLEPRQAENVGWLRLDGWPIPENAVISIEAKDYLLSVRHRT